MIRAALILALLFCGCTQRVDTANPSRKKIPPPKTAASKFIDETVSIDFSESHYSFPIAKVAQGIEINYDVVVRDDVANVLPLSQHSHSNVQIDLVSPVIVQTCALEPFARLSGNEQFFGEFQVGCLAAPETISPAVLEHGRYAHTFNWNGRNLAGDGGGGQLPYGDPFPPGEYELTIRCTGKVVTHGVAEDFEINNNVIVTLTD